MVLDYHANLIVTKQTFQNTQTAKLKHALNEQIFLRLIVRINRHGLVELFEINHRLTILCDRHARRKHPIDHNIFRSIAKACLECGAGNGLGSLDKHDDFQVSSPNCVQNELARDYTSLLCSTGTLGCGLDGDVLGLGSPFLGAKTLSELHDHAARAVVLQGIRAVRGVRRVRRVRRVRLFGLVGFIGLFGFVGFVGLFGFIGFVGGF